ncbi:hypothetical protein HMPREF0484_0246 [Klebsiella pneumoniae subsp. rhinoscleromatis ATCC 13884]|nr:hypothetical protein HMPREF0484_0246 [Klebsiella pneumoniae subsp. rhinoscleromatis ATCC 13884]
MTINSSRFPAGFCLISNQERWVYHFAAICRAEFKMPGKD